MATLRMGVFGELTRRIPFLVVKYSRLVTKISFNSFSQADQLDTARLLVEFSADIKIVNSYGLTPLDIAQTFGRLSFINMFTAGTAGLQ